MRAWADLGRVSQAAALALTATLGADGWFIVEAAIASDGLPKSATFQLAGTWPSCEGGLRPRTDYCVYSVQKALDWTHAIESLNATGDEEAALKTVNKPLLEMRVPWPPETLFVVWRGLTPENHK